MAALGEVMTVKELKDRLRPGVRLLLVEDVLGRHRTMRRVVRRTTRGCLLGDAEVGGAVTEMLWPRKRHLRPFPGGFAILTGAGALYMKFLWVDQPTAPPDGSGLDAAPRAQSPPAPPARDEPDRPALYRRVPEASRDDAISDARLRFGPRSGTCSSCGHPFAWCECLYGSERQEVLDDGF